jgi:hypothetical protein
MINFTKTQERTLQDIRAFAQGSIYRLNAAGCDSYAFTFINGGKSWEGGWDDSKKPFHTDEAYRLNLATGGIAGNTRTTLSAHY